MTSVPLLVTFGVPSGLFALLLLIPIVVLFLLKRRYKDRTVASTLLWQALLKEEVSRSPIRRPREWLSLLLLLFATALIAAALADMRVGKAKTVSQAILVLDVSASMTTREESKTRLELALDGAKSMVSSLAEGSEVTIVLAASPPRVLLHPTDELNLATSVLNEVHPTLATSDLLPAVEIAASIASARKEVQATTIFVFSDFADVSPTRVEAALQDLPSKFIICGTAKGNVGITHAAVANTDTSTHLLATVAGNAGAEGTKRLVLERNGVLVDARDVDFSESKRQSFDFVLMPESKSGGAEYRLRLEPADDFTWDDALSFGVSPRKPPKVLHYGPRDPFLDRLQQTFPEIEMLRVHPKDPPLTPSESYDLALWSADTLPTWAADIRARRQFLIGCAPKEVEDPSRDVVPNPVVVDWNRTDVRMRGVGFENLAMLEAYAWKAPAGSEVLLRTSAGATLYWLDRQDSEVMVWAAPLTMTNFPLIPAFPVLLRNLLDGGLPGLKAYFQSGAEPLSFEAGLGELTGDVRIVIESPVGAKHQASLRASESCFWPGDVEPGLYIATSESAGVKARRALGVGLLSEQETTSTPASEPSETRSEKSQEVIFVQDLVDERARWPLLLGLAGALLLLEAFLLIPLRRRNPSKNPSRS